MYPATLPSSTAAPVRDPAALLNIRAAAALLGCFSRHVYSLADAGGMPAPVKLGALIRWRQQEIDAWIDGRRQLPRTGVRS
jgi:excisionase family DNA binding protein